MTEPLQEYVNSSSQRLNVDRAAGVIHGVKLLGLASRNGRRYREQALAEAIGLYEGAKVNINHPKGHPLSPRDYQDRLGAVRNVQLRSGEGLFGDLHFNPKHVLSEQLMWDAEHAPRNVGMSHNVLARTSRSGEETIVEAITKVQSIDLVADPASTDGLYESLDGEGGSTVGRETVVTLQAATLEDLRNERPDLLLALEQSHALQLEQLREELEAVTAREAALQRRQLVVQLLEEHGLPQPSDGSVDSRLVSATFFESLMRAKDESVLRAMVEERASLVRSACEWRGPERSPIPRPKSREQTSLNGQTRGVAIQSPQQFAAALRGGRIVRSP